MGGCASVPIKFKKAEAGGVPTEAAKEEPVAAPVEEQKTAEEVKTEVEETKEEKKTETEVKAEDEKDSPSLGTLLDKDEEKKEKSGEEAANAGEPKKEEVTAKVKAEETKKE